MSGRLSAAAVHAVADAIYPGYADAPDSVRERARDDARELLQLARRQGTRQRRRETELRDELAAIVAGADRHDYPAAA